MIKQNKIKTAEQKSQIDRNTNLHKKTSMFDFAEIETMIPKDGSLTFSFTIKAPGIIRMLYVPTFKNIESKSANILNKPKPFIIETAKPETVTKEIREITEESKKYLHTLKEKQSKTTSRVEELKQARENIEKQIQELQSETPSTENKTQQQPIPPQTKPRQRHTRSITLSDIEIAAIPKLPEKQAQILRLKYIENKSMKEIATQLQYTIANAYNNHNQALKNLAKITQKEDK